DMRKIIVGAFVAMDGVMQAPGAPTEDPTQGLKFGGWEVSCFDQEARQELDRVSAPHSFKLTSSRVSSSGILIGHYERDGEIKIVDGALDSPSKREIARQERMKRER